MRALLRLLGFPVLLAALFSMGYSWRNLREGELPDAVTIRAMLTGDSPDNASIDDLYRSTFDRIESDYYRKVDPTALKYAGIEGMVSSLGDPHTIFFPPSAAKQFEMDTQGRFEGVGARLESVSLGAKLSSVFKDGPAYKAGVRAGDTIVEVDHKSTAGLGLDVIVSRIRGPKGTVVSLTVLRPGSNKRVTYQIRRARVVTPTVMDDHVIEGTHVGYMAVSIFAETTADQFNTALDGLESQKIDGLIIDLRGNGGGLLRTAVLMLSRFIEDKVVVRMVERDGDENVVRTDEGLKQSGHVPIVILVNQDSASASEIFSGVMQQYHVATLVGTHTYGKASVQNIFPLRDGSSAKITIARYLLPDGEDIGRKVDEDGRFVSGGLKPDYPCDFDLDDPLAVIGDPKKDPQLAKAIQVLEQK